MRNQDLHPSGQDLLHYVDGELSTRNARRIRVHLSACWECRTRMVEIEIAIADFVRAHRHDHEPTSDIAGPRALLKARLAELATSADNERWRYLRFMTDARGLAYVGALTLLIAFGIHILYVQNARYRDSSGVYARSLPNPSLTPGSTRQVAFADLCSSDRDEVVHSVPDSLRRKIFAEYGMRGAPQKDYEVDYLITPGLGGSDGVQNLWPEPHSNTVWNSYVKDQLENHLHHMVCGGTLSLDQAQKDIAGNWIQAYKKYFHTDRPLPRSLASSVADHSVIFLKKELRFL